MKNRPPGPAERARDAQDGAAESPAGAFFLFALAGFCAFAPLLTTLFTPDDIVHYFIFDYRPWLSGFSNHGRLGQAALFLGAQALGVNMVRDQIGVRAASILLMAGASFAVYRAAQSRVRSPRGKALCFLGCLLAVFSAYAIELLAFGLAQLTYAISVFLSLLAAAQLSEEWDRSHLCRAFVPLFLAYWFYQNTPPFFVAFGLLFACTPPSEGEPLQGALRRAGLVLGMYLAASAANLLYVTKLHPLLFHSAHTARISSDVLQPFRMFFATLERAAQYFWRDYGLPTARVGAPLTLGAGAVLAAACWKEKRALALLCSCAASLILLSVAPVALNTELYVPARSIPAIGGLMGFFLVFAALRPLGRKASLLLLSIGLAFGFGVTLDAARVSAMMRVSNRLDIERAKQICRLIAGYEAARKTAVRKVFFVPDRNPTLFYPGLASFPDMSASMFVRSWSPSPLLRFVSGRDLPSAVEGADAGIVGRIMQSDWTPIVDGEQVFVKGDAAYVAVE